jgi:hypothetical protein
MQGFIVFCVAELKKFDRKREVEGQRLQNKDVVWDSGEGGRNIFSMFGYL